MKAITGLFYTPKVQEVSETPAASIELPVIGEATGTKEIKAERIDTDRVLLNLIQTLQDDPEAKKALQEKLNPEDREHQIIAKLLQLDKEALEKAIFEKELIDDGWEFIEQTDEKKPWRWYHIVTVPAKYTWKGGKLVWKGYRFISKAVLPVGVAAIALYSPWLPVLTTLLKLLA